MHKNQNYICNITNNNVTLCVAVEEFEKDMQKFDCVSSNVRNITSMESKQSPLIGPR